MVGISLISVLLAGLLCSALSLTVPLTTLSGIKLQPIQDGKISVTSRATTFGSLLSASGSDTLVVFAVRRPG